MDKKYLNHIALEVKNILQFREQRIDLKSGEVTEVAGGNGRGKSTLLNSLRWVASGGKCQVPDWLVTDNEKAGSMAATFDGEFTSHRTVKAGETATELLVIDSNGEPANGGKSPASVLKRLLGDGSHLNPVSIVEMGAEERVKTIAAALEIDPTTAAAALAEITGRTWKITSREEIFPAIQQAHDALYEQRRQKKNDYEAADAQADGVIAFLPAEWMDAKGDIPPPVEPKPLGDIYDRKRAAEVKNGEREQLNRDIAELEAVLMSGQNQTDGDENQLRGMESDLLALGIEEDEAALEDQIRQLQLQLEQMKGRNTMRQSLATRISNAKESVERNKATLAGYKERLAAKQTRERELGGMEDVSALQAQIDAHEDQMTIYREALKVHGECTVRYAQAHELRENAVNLREEWEVLQAKVASIDHLPIKLLKGVKLPIPGMEIRADDIYLPDGDVLRKFDAFGEADRYRFAARFSIDLASINVLILDGVERCDIDRKLELYRMAAEADFIVFSSVVTRGPVVINHLSLNDIHRRIETVTLPAEVGGEPTTVEAAMPITEADIPDIPDDLEEAPQVAAPTLF